MMLYRNCAKDLNISMWGSQHLSTDTNSMVPKVTEPKLYQWEENYAWLRAYPNSLCFRFSYQIE